MFKNFIWDADGTLIDSIPGIISCYKKIINEYKFEVDDNELKKLENILRKQNSESCRKYIEDKYKIPINKFNERYKVLSNEEKYIKNIRFLDNSIGICKKIKQVGKRNFIITNQDESILKILENLNALEYFEDIIFIGRYNIFTKKPEIDSFKYLIDKHKIKVEETLSIGDRDIDVFTSQKINIKTCLFNPPEGFKTRPDYIINSFKELEKFI